MDGRYKQMTPLCVDLDGTLIKTDMLIESVVLLLRQNPLIIFLFPIWIMKGKSNFKRQIASRVSMDVSCLPYNREFLSYLNEEYHTGRKLVLVTASDMLIARPIADFVEIFSEVIASDGKINLKGSNKLKAIKNKLEGQAFDYAGNSNDDLVIWRECNEAIVVNASRKTLENAKKISKVSKHFNNRKNYVRSFIKSLRCHQWFKNVLIFIPVITSHQIMNLQILTDAIIAFIAFCFCSSSAYILNDLMDLETDRNHFAKKYRPFAAGEFPLAWGIILAPLLLSISLLIAIVLNREFLFLLSTYYLVTLLYSVRLKEVVLVDVVTLAVLYTFRVVGGNLATAIPVSNWLLAFTVFLFFSLALIKRYSELYAIDNQQKRKIMRRDYSPDDKNIVAMFGTASGYISVLVLAFYINSKQILVLYKYPQLLWLLCLVLLYWISRMWLITYRGKMDTDPLVYAMKDKSTYITAVVAALILILATV